MPRKVEKPRERLKLSEREYPLGNAYCFVPIGKTNLVYRHYARRFPVNVEVHIDEAPITSSEVPKGITGRQLLERFYLLNPRPIKITHVKDKNEFGIRRRRWIVLYPMHFVGTMELSDDRNEPDDHSCTLYYRDYEGRWHDFAYQIYEGKFDRDQPDNLIQQFKEWREDQTWWQNGDTRERVYDLH